MSKRVRVRFAPSPTGGLHVGGVRTVLYNYLFARKNGGDFVLRIEDTDQARYVPGAEQYIFDCLAWCGLTPDEGPHIGGQYGPYRQSERKEIYHKYAQQLVDQGYAYYAFDTPEELEEMRMKYKSEQNPSPQYNHILRNKMSNSIVLNKDQVREKLDAGVPYVIRIKLPENEIVGFNDMIRGEVNFNTNQVDDKVLLKADGMPTYHLAVVVDDYMMKITHAFRGEEWLPSAPVHVLLWKYLGWESDMPQWAHLPLILKPDGNGKLSKRDGERLGFPVFAMDWKDPKTGDHSSGYKEIGFLPEAFINMLAMLGWNDGTGQEIFSIDELVHQFSMDRVHKGGAKFDFEKAKWFNHEWIKKSSASVLLAPVKKILDNAGIQDSDDAYLGEVIQLVKDRCTLLTDFLPNTSYFFNDPVSPDVSSIKPKWTEEKSLFFNNLSAIYLNAVIWNAAALEESFKELATNKNIKPGEVLLPLRIMLVGGKFGPGVFDIAALIGKEKTIRRINHALTLL